MGTTKKKSTSSKKKTNSTSTNKRLTKAQMEELEKKKQRNNEIKGIIWIFVGVLFMFFAVKQDAGKVGTFISNLLVCAFGNIGKYIFTVVFIAAGLFIVFKKKETGYFIIASGLLLDIAVSIPETAFEYFSFKEKEMYKALWTTPTNGGFLGNIIAQFLKNNISATGTWIAVVFLFILCFVVILRKSFFGTIKEVAEDEKEKREERKRERLIEEAEQAAEREASKNVVDLDKTRTVLQTQDGTRLVVIEPDLKDKRGRKLTRSNKTKQKKTSGKYELFDEEAGAAYNEGDTLSGSGSRIASRRSGSPLSADEDIKITKGVSDKRKITERKEDTKEDNEPQLKTRKPARRNNEIDIDLDNNDDVIISSSGKSSISEEDPDKNRYIPIKNNSNTNKSEGFTIGEIIAQSNAPLSSPKKDTYVKPSYRLLDAPSANTKLGIDRTQTNRQARIIEETLSEFGVDGKVTNVTVGPALTQYEFKKGYAVKLTKVENLADDVAIALAAKSVRIDRIPGKDTIGIEVPNAKIQTVKASDVMQSKEFVQHKSPVAAVLGLTLTGESLVMDISTTPHLLIAGATGSGKSVCINMIIMSLLYHSSPSEVRMILIDPKMVELNVYEGIPHLLIPVVTDPKNAAGALTWAVREMTKRYETFSENSVRNIDGYNTKMESTGGEKLPRIVLVIDEMADLMMVAKQQVEASVQRLGQLARAAGIHLIIATQRPSVDVLSGTIKANIPSRIAFAVSSSIDSRTILDRTGAEKLLGRGDMLYNHQSLDEPIRAQGAFITDDEIERVVKAIIKKHSAVYDENVKKEIASAVQDASPASQKEIVASDGNSDEDLLIKAMELAFEKGEISTSAIQRRLKIGYARAGRIVDELEENGFISGPDGAKPRKVLIGKSEFYAQMGVDE